MSNRIEVTQLRLVGFYRANPFNGLSMMSAMFEDKDKKLYEAMIAIKPSCEDGVHKAVQRMISCDPFPKAEAKQGESVTEEKAPVECPA